MSPELISAVKERIDLGRSDDEIKEELRGAGYTDEMLDQVLAEAKSGPASIPPAGGTVTLPGVIELFKSSISAVFGRLDLALFLFAPLAITTVLATLTGANLLEENTTFNATSGAITLIGGLVYVVFLFATVFIVSNSAIRKVSFKEGIDWTKKNGLSLIWVNLLTAFVVWGGMILFIIPGIIISVYLYLSQFALAREGLKGMDALMRSRELVYGKWLPVFGRLLGVGLLSFLVIFLIFIPVGIVSLILIGEDPESIVNAPKAMIIILGLIDNFINVFFTIFSLFVGIKMFESLSSARPVFDQEVSKSARKKYKILAWIGPIFIILGIFAAVMLASLDDARDQALGDQNRTIENVEAKDRAVELR